MKHPIGTAASSLQAEYSIEHQLPVPDAGHFLIKLGETLFIMILPPDIAIQCLKMTIFHQESPLIARSTGGRSTNYRDVQYCQ